MRPFVRLCMLGTTNRRRKSCGVGEIGAYGNGQQRRSPLNPQRKPAPSWRLAAKAVVGSRYAPNALHPAKQNPNGRPCSAAASACRWAYGNGQQRRSPLNPQRKPAPSWRLAAKAVVGSRYAPNRLHPAKQNPNGRPSSAAASACPWAYGNGQQRRSPAMTVQVSTQKSVSLPRIKRRLQRYQWT